MVLLVSDVTLEAAALLNDANQRMYSDVVLLPFVKKAWKEIENKFIELGVPTVVDWSAAISVPASTTEANITLPSNLISPISLQERVVGQDDTQWVDMEEVGELPSRVRTSTITEWEWRGDTIKILGATQANEVRIRYERVLSSVAAVGDSLPVLGCQTFMSTRTAADAAERIGENSERAQKLKQEADGHLEVLVNTKVLELQNLRNRRLPYRGVSYRDSGRR